jgi:hypothetical protein
MGTFRCRSVRGHSLIGQAILAPFASVGLAASSNSTTPAATLQHAMWLGDLDNWAAAEPMFHLAEAQSHRNGDQRNRTLARLGIIRSTAQRRNLPQTSAQLEDQLDGDPLLQSDHEARLFCLRIKAEIDGEMQSIAARRDWERVAELAKELGDNKWQNRSLAGIGIAAFYSGDFATARQNIGAALVAATRIGDVGTQVQYLYAVGMGLLASQTYLKPWYLDHNTGYFEQLRRGQL